MFKSEQDDIRLLKNRLEARFMTEETLFWADQLADKIVEERGENTSYIFNCGMSVSGKMHIGNLRGELLIPSSIRYIMEKERGKEISFRGVYYTQDRFKAKEEQLKHFDIPEQAKKYEGWRLIDVPDPYSCHENWVQHFNSENQPYLRQYGIHVDPVTTTEFYRMDETKKVVEKFLEKREKVRKVLNRYRDRKPYPEDWIPFDPHCKECNRIDSTDTIDFDLEEWTVKYECDNCGSSGTSEMEKGKLAWRLEWTALWEVLGVDFEPYGKDHATEGGSRDSCIELAKEFGFNYPTGFSFNWVYLKHGDGKSEMTSSGDVGITASEWLEIAEPEILNYLYMSSRPMTEIYFSPEEMPTYYRRFDEAEAVYFGMKEADDEKEKRNLSRAYELSMKDLPEEKPVRVPFDHAGFLAQTVPEEKWNRKAIESLKRTGHVPEDVSEENIDRVLDRLEKAKNWAKQFAPEEDLYSLNYEVPESVIEEMDEDQKEAVRLLAEMLKEREFKDSDELDGEIFGVKDETELGTGAFFSTVYQVMLSRDQGPRLSRLIMSVGQDKTVEILKQLD